MISVRSNTIKKYSLYAHYFDGSLVPAAVRAVVDGSGTSLETDDYYPLGDVIIYDGDLDFSSMTAVDLLYNESFDILTQQGEANTYDMVRSVLTDNAKSKIWTHIVSQLEGQHSIQLLRLGEPLSILHTETCIKSIRIINHHRHI